MLRFFSGVLKRSDLRSRLLRGEEPQLRNHKESHESRRSIFANWSSALNGYMHSKESGRKSIGSGSDSDSDHADPYADEKLDLMNRINAARKGNLQSDKEYNPCSWSGHL